MKGRRMYFSQGGEVLKPMRGSIRSDERENSGSEGRAYIEVRRWEVRKVRSGSEVRGSRGVDVGRLREGSVKKGEWEGMNLLFSREWEYIK